jgi:hypothetical protein
MKSELSKFKVDPYDRDDIKAGFREKKCSYRCGTTIYGRTPLFYLSEALSRRGCFLPRSADSKWYRICTNRVDKDDLHWLCPSYGPPNVRAVAHRTAARHRWSDDTRLSGSRWNQSQRARLSNRSTLLRNTWLIEYRRTSLRLRRAQARHQAREWTVV